MTDAARDTASGDVFRLVYRSRNLIPAEERKEELGRLFSQARRDDKGRGVTGALLVHADWFVQVLEGEEATVRSLYATIARDRRHEFVTLLHGQRVPNRRFARWAMARVSDDGDRDIPLIAHTDGIARAAGHPTTPEQEEVLGVVRDAVRAAAETV
ncbi:MULTISPECIES: BLUF domain-containing protein [unclassified Geodermatophilus]